MQLLIDSLVANNRPELIKEFTEHNPECVLATFDFLSAAVSLNEAVGFAEPDVVVVDAVWLHLAALLRQLLEEHGATKARVIVAAQCVDQIFLAQVAHRGYTNYVDLSLPTHELALQLCHVSNQGGHPLNDDAAGLWSTVPQPPAVDSYHDTPRDEIDNEILRLLSVGMQDIDISHIIHASPQTVKNRISAMLDRSGLRNRTQLAWLHHNHAMVDAVRRSSNGRRRETVIA